MKILILIAVILGFSSPGFAASFDCTKVSTLVETAICSDSELSSLDDSLAVRYKQALRHAFSVTQVKERQRAWLKQRNTCKTAGCLQEAYRARLAELTATTSSQPVASSGLPVRIDECVTTQLVDKNTRFDGAKPGEVGGEVYVSFANQVGLYITSIPHLAPGVDPDAYMARTQDFARGDKVRLCLVSLPEDCPPGDDRGKVYSVSNLKNQMSFIGIDAWHTCGGA